MADDSKPAGHLVIYGVDATAQPNTSVDLEQELTKVSINTKYISASKVILIR